MSQNCTPDSIHMPTYPLKALGYYRTFGVVVPIDVATAQASLPDELEIMPQDITPSGTHPLMLLFGKQFDVHPNFAPILNMTYLEHVSALPFVRYRDTENDYKGPFAFLPKLYLNELLPTLLGHLYAYPKTWARVAGNPPYDEVYSVHGLLSGDPIVQAVFERSGPQAPADHFEHFAKIRSIFEMPFIGQYEFGSLICSNLNFKIPQATIQSATANVAIQREYIQGLAPSTYQSVGIEDSPLGGFYMATPWELTPPFGCDCIKCS